MPKLYYKYTERITGGEALEPGPWAERADEYVNFTIQSVHANTIEGWDVQTLDVVFDPKTINEVCLVVVTYDTGNTFGRSLDHVEVEGAYTSIAEALAVKKSIEDKTYPGWQPWDGYFERLTNIDIQVFEVFHS